METHRAEEIWAELCELLRKQRGFLESRMLGTVRDSDLLAYEVRQKTIDQLCKALSRSGAA